MRKKGRLWAVLLSMALLLGGCQGRGSDAEGEAPAQKRKAPLVQEDAREGAMPDAGDKQTGYTDGSLQTPLRGELTIGCFYQAEILEIAAKQFQERYPDVRIEIHAFEGGGKNAVEDYLTSMNTKIMTGKAEDILMTAYLPIRKYSGMGVFADLQDLAEDTPEFTPENYFQNVLFSAREESGALYLLPYQAGFSLMSFSGALLEEQSGKRAELEGQKKICFTEAFRIAQELAEGSHKKNVFLSHQRPSACAYSLLMDEQEKYFDWEKKEVFLDTPEYVRMLEQLGALSKKGYFDADVDFYNEEYYFAMTDDFDIQAAFFALDRRADQAYCMPCVNAKGEFAIRANNCVAINSASQNKELAWAFIRYLLSEEIQSLPCIYGPAVHKKGFAASVERYYQIYEDGSNGESGVSKEAYLALLTDCMEQVTSCDTLDTAIATLIIEENEKYFTGALTAGETARSLQEKLTQYLNE